MYCRLSIRQIRNNPVRFHRNICISKNHSYFHADHRISSTAGSHRFAGNHRQHTGHDHRPIHIRCYQPEASLSSAVLSDFRAVRLRSVPHRPHQSQCHRSLYLQPWLRCHRNNTAYLRYPASRLPSLRYCQRSTSCCSASASSLPWLRFRSYNTSDFRYNANRLP